MLLIYKLKREIFRLTKPFLSPHFFNRTLNRLQRELEMYEARPTLHVQARLLFKKPQFFPHPQPIDILIPIYNSYEYLLPCLQSILKNTDLPYHIYLADDHSTDPKILPFLKAWQREHPACTTLIQNTRNEGFAKTVNKLIAASENDFVLLNTDTELPPAWATRLFYPIFTDANIASCGPWSNSGALQNFFFNHKETPLDVNLETLDNALKDISPDLKIHLPTITGFCMAIRRKAAQQIGLLDEIYGRGYYEETDWCMRASTAGFQHQLVPNLFVFHKGRGSFGVTEFDSLMKHNCKIFTQRHPFAHKRLKSAAKEPLFQTLSFIVLARYLSLKFPGFVNSTHPLPTQPVLSQQKNCFTLQWKHHFAAIYQKEDIRPLLTPQTKRPHSQ